MEVVRVGPFTAESDGTYLGYLSSQKTLAQLNGELLGQFRVVGRALQNASPQNGYARAVVDPASGGLMGLYVDRPNLARRINEGEVVGYVIIAVGVIGLLFALFQAVYLVIARLAVGAQLRDLRNPKPNNPLGRVLLAFRGDEARRERRARGAADLRGRAARGAEARAVPGLPAAWPSPPGPLLGLIGTVIGMIITFRAIVASGTERSEDHGTRHRPSDDRDRARPRHRDSAAVHHRRASPRCRAPSRRSSTSRASRCSRKASASASKSACNPVRPARLTTGSRLCPGAFSTGGVARAHCTARKDPMIKGYRPGQGRLQRAGDPLGLARVARGSISSSPPRAKKRRSSSGSASTFRRVKRCRRSKSRAASTSRTSRRS